VDVILATFSTLPRPASFASVDELHAGIFERLADRRKVVLDWKTAAGFEIGHGCIDSGGISPRFTAGEPRTLQQPQLRQKPRQTILDHEPTLGHREKLPAGKSEPAPAPAGPSLSSPPPAAQPGAFGFFIF
jgi:hypothetical protein